MQSRGRAVSIPGFTAERSLDVRRAPYSMTATRFLSAEGGIRPQMSKACENQFNRIMDYAEQLGQAYVWASISGNRVPHTAALNIVNSEIARFRTGNCHLDR
jgi:hypothetical protein